MQTPTSVLLVITTLPDMQIAKSLARALVEARIAACVSIGAPIQSIYRWQDAIEEASEIPLQIKTSSANYQQVEAMIISSHPYDVPEIIAVPINIGLPAYLHWVLDDSASTSHA